MNTDVIYLLQNGDREELVEMSVQEYATEDLLQKLLADYPKLLAGTQINPTEPRRWLLISREMGVPGEEAGSNRWSLDHLFLDQDGIPTLIEVKRSSDTRARREVVAQMLDYAANGVKYWPVEKIKTAFEITCAKSLLNSVEVFNAFLEPGMEPEHFWNSVKTNLQAGKIRMIFVADFISPELQRIIEFLNEQMDPAEILAVEVKQYEGKGLKILVPRLLGQTAQSQIRKATTVLGETRQWDEKSFFEEVKKTTNSKTQDFIRKAYDWSKPKANRCWWEGVNKKALAW